MTEQPAPEGEPIADDIIAAVSDYLDGVLPPDRRAEVAGKVASDPEWKRAHDEISATREALSGLQKARAPGSFDQEVTGTINRRSAGRFFGRRTLGDRVPFGLLLVIAIVLLLAIAYVVRSSVTGSLKPPPKEDPAAVPRSSPPLLPKP